MFVYLSQKNINQTFIIVIYLFWSLDIVRDASLLPFVTKLRPWVGMALAQDHTNRDTRVWVWNQLCPTQESSIPSPHECWTSEKGGSPEVQNLSQVTEKVVTKKKKNNNKGIFIGEKDFI